MGVEHSFLTFIFSVDYTSFSLFLFPFCFSPFPFVADIRICSAAAAASTHAAAVAAAISPDKHALLGRPVRKYFRGYGWFQGQVASYLDPYFTVRYDDGDEEELEIRAVLQ